MQYYMYALRRTCHRLCRWLNLLEHFFKMILVFSLSLSLSQVQNARKHNKGYKIGRYIQFHESVHFQNILFTNGQLLDPL